MAQLLQQAQQMQQQLVAAQEELARTEVTGSAGGGLVTATMTGSGDSPRVTIAPAAVDPDDIETLQDLVVAALHDAKRGGRRARRRAPWARSPAASAAAAGGLGPARRPPDRTRNTVYEGAVQDLIDELGPPARRRAEERPAHRLPPAGGRVRRRQPAGRRADPGAGGGPLLRDLLQRRRGRAVPHLPRPAPRSTTSCASSRSPRTSSPSSAPVSSAAATTCSAARSARSTASAPTTCGSRSS